MPHPQPASQDSADLSPGVPQRWLPPLGRHLRDRAGLELQATLVDLVDLALVGKQLHWSVVGVQFRSIHLMLDEFVATWRELSDTVAERAVTIGFWPDAQAGTVATATAHAAQSAGPVKGSDAVREIGRRIATVAEETRARMDRLGEVDIVSQDVLVGVVRALEQQSWMSRAQVEED